MRITWILVASLVFVALVSGAMAGPVETDLNNNGPEQGGSKTWHAIKNFFRPMTDYFRSVHKKTPSDVATDVKETVTDMKEWAKENEAIQSLLETLAPVKNWVKEKADVIKDKTFKEMYDDVKARVSDIDDKIGTWIEERRKAEYQAEAL